MGDGGGGTRRNSPFHGGARWGLPEFAKSGTPGVKKEWASIGDAPHAMCDPLEATGRRLGARSRDFGWCGDAAAEVLAGAGCWCRAGVSSGRKKFGNECAGVCEVRTWHGQGWTAM